MKKIARLYLTALLLIAHPTWAAPVDALDRTGLTPTFADEFDSFSWHQPSASGTWSTYFGYSWAKPDDIKNRVQLSNKEEGLNIDPSFRGTGDKPLGINPFSIKNGTLHITANRAADLPALSGYRYTTGLISTQFSFAQRYGVFEIRAKLPKGKGLWPAFWLLPADKSWPPEIDVLEMLGHETTKYYTTLHTKSGDKHEKSAIPVHTVPDTSADFHTYTVDWGPRETIFYFDNREVARHPTYADMHKPFYIIANLAVGGSWPGSPDAQTQFPASYEIDWIRAWQRADR